MCSIDALGAGAMYASDTVIETACHGCGASLRIATRDAGQALAEVTPAGAILWAA